MHECGSGLDVEHVGVAQVLAVQLNKVVAEVAVEGRLLVWVVAIAQLAVQGQADGEGFLGNLLLVQEARDGCIVFSVCFQRGVLEQ